MGLHTGTATPVPDGYIGMDVHRAARIAAAGHGGQVLLSAATAELVQDALPDGVTLIDLGAHALRDVPQPERLCQMSIDGLETEFPAIRAVGVGTGNLPAPLTTFVGREEELAALTARVVSRPLVTLVGSGGTGKSRLAIEVGRAVDAEFSDGVWFVPLADVSDPRLVADTVGRTLGIEGGSSRPMAERLIDHLRGRRLLFILDNCEHLAGACAELVPPVLSGAPGVRILATSRQPLGLGGEELVPVGPLRLPPREVRREQAMRSAAVQLFIERATAARPGFTYDDEDLGRIVEVVRDLEGIPLAIELAAARAAVLTPSQIADRLDDRFRLLRAATSAVEPRHRTLEATIGWSYELLTSSEQLLLQRLSIFAGGCTLEACERVVSGDGIDDFEVLDLLAALVERSLVVADTGGAQGRYRMLETIRRYAADRLAESGDEDRWRGRHATWCVEVCDLPPELADGYRAISDEMLALFDREQDNLRAGFDWLVAGGDAERALRMITGLGWFWYIRGYWIEGTDRALAALDLPAPVPDLVRARALTAVSILAFRRGMDASVAPLAEEALALDRKLGDQARIAYSTMISGLPCIALGHYEREFALGEEAYQIATEAGATLVAASSQLLMGRAVSLMGDFEGSIEHQRVSEQLFASIDATWGVASSLFGQANGALGLGRLDEAKDLLERSMATASTIGALDELGPSLLALGYIALVSGDEEGGEAQLSAGWEDIRSRRDWGGALAVGIVAQFLALVGRQERARALLEGLLEMAEESADPNAQGSTLVGLAWFGVLSGDVAEAARRATQVLELQGGRADHRGVFNGLIAAALILQASGEISEAAKLATGGTDVLAAGGLPLRTIERTLLGTLPTADPDSSFPTDPATAARLGIEAVAPYLAG
jgi:predicted ATPase/tetratricopeptide (TPR) repeat protein